MKRQKNYDKKVKQTRILLSDYLLLKSLAQRAGVSMSEALHKIITRDWAMARKAEPVAVATKPALRVTPQPAFRATTLVTLPVKPEPILATNGHKPGMLVIKPKGGVTND